MFSVLLSLLYHYKLNIFVCLIVGLTKQDIWDVTWKLTRAFFTIFCLFFNKLINQLTENIIRKLIGYESNRREGNWKRVKSDLAFVKVNAWPFVDEEVVALTVLHELVCVRCQNYCVRISVICLLVSVCEGFHNLWIYTSSVFTLTLTRINQESGGALGICLFSKNKVNKANKSS